MLYLLDTLKRLDLAFQHFFRRVKNGETPEFPRFKPLHRFRGWGYKTHGDGWRLITNERMKHGTLRLAGVGDYAPQGGGISTGMRRAMNNQSVIARFREDLAWVALKSGKHSLVFNETGTTRTCSACGYVVAGGIAPDVRAWYCPGCGTHHVRDENAAQNGLKRLLLEQSENDGLVPSVSGSGLVAIKRRWTWRVRPGGIESRGGWTEVNASTPGN